MVGSCCWLCVVSITLLSLCGASSGALCYKCSSEDTKACNDPFKPTKDMIVTCDSFCYKTVTKSGKVYRGCAETHMKKRRVYPRFGSIKPQRLCRSDIIPFVGHIVQCVCDDVYCNAATLNISRWLILWLVCFLMYKCIPLF